MADRFYYYISGKGDGAKTIEELAHILANEAKFLRRMKSLGWELVEPTERGSAIAERKRTEPSRSRPRKKRGGCE